MTSRQYWLLKTEPGAWSWQDQVKNKITAWDGVRNYQASNNMKAMNIGDLCFFYHSVSDKMIMGIVEVVKLYYPDPSDSKGRFGMVDVRYLVSLKNPVPLEYIKSDERLKDLALVRQSRLSVMPIDPQPWKIICEKGGIHDKDL